MSTLIQDVHAEIQEWLAIQSKLFSGERDMQVSLAIYLEKSGKFSKVYTEYRVPLSELKIRGVPVEPNQTLAKEWHPQPTFPWNNDVSVDIVVERAGKFTLVELKYATRKVNTSESLFGEPLKTDECILKNQAASNIVMYAYWKDVRRIETICEKYQNIDGGFALMITNCSDYWNAPRGDAKYAPFSMHEGHIVGSGTLDWNNASDSNHKHYPPFILRGIYSCRWLPTKIKACAQNGDPFRAMLSVIKK